MAVGFSFMGRRTKALLFALGRGELRLRVEAALKAKAGKAETRVLRSESGGRSLEAPAAYFLYI